MTQEEKAQEICEKNARYGVDCSSLECYLSAIEMASWKQKQIIEKACEWIRDQKEMIGISFGEDFIERFRKAMEDNQ